MLIQFPGCPDRFRDLLAVASIETRGWAAFEARLRKSFPGIETAICSIPTSAPVRQPLRLAASASSHAFALPVTAPQCAVAGTLIAPRIINDSELRSAGILHGIVLSSSGGSTELFTAVIPADRKERYNQGLQVLLSRLSHDLVDAYATARHLGTQKRPVRDRLEAQWDRLAQAVALVEPNLSIAAANMAMQCLMSDRKVFRPLKARDRLVPADPDAYDRLHESVEDVANGRIEQAAVCLKRTGGGRLRLSLRPARRPDGEAFISRPAVLVTARP